MSAAATVLYAVTAWAYRVTVLDAEAQPLDVYTGGNSRFDSAGFVPARSASAESLSTMRKYAKQTALETAATWGVPVSSVGYDKDEEEALRDAYKPLNPLNPRD